MIATIVTILTVTKREIGQAVNRRVHVAIAWIAAGAGGAGFVSMALVSLHRYVSREAGAFYADGVIGLVFLVVAVAALIYARAETKRVRSPSEIRDRIMLAAPVAARIATTRPKIALVGLALAALAGVITGRSIRSGRNERS